MIEIPFTSSVVGLSVIISQGIFASVLLMLSFNNAKPNRYLGLLLFTFSLWLMDDFFNAALLYQQNPNLYFLPIYFSFAFGPLIYIYTKSITQADFKFKKRHLWHFVPVLIQGLLYIFLQCKNYTFRRWFWQEVHLPYTYNIEFIGSLISLIIYMFLSIHLVKMYQKWLNDNYSDIAKINLNWLKIVLATLIGISALWMLDSILRVFWQYYPTHDFSTIAMGCSLLVLAGGALLQSNLKQIGIDVKEPNSEKEEIHQNIDQVLVEKIKSSMSKQKLFLNTNLTLQVFAKELQEPSRRVSNHINYGLRKSFIDFVNECRVKEFKQNVQDGKMKHMTLSGIALESGFNSKSTFNRVFKKMTGESPSTYQKRVQNTV